jgi:hypothetical protein
VIQRVGTFADIHNFVKKKRGVRVGGISNKLRNLKKMDSA